MAFSINRDQGDTAPALTTQLFLGGTYFNLTGASVVGVIGGTVGSGPLATYRSWLLAATWNTASLGRASIAIPLNPSALAPSNFPCASAARLMFEVRAVDSGGAIYNWPAADPIPFLVRIKVA